MNQTQQISSSLVHGVPDAWMEQTRQLADAIMALAPNASTNPVIRTEARQLANVLLQSASDLASRYQDIDSAIFIQGLRARLVARFEKCPELYPFIQGTVTWMLKLVEEYPALAVLAIYASLLLLIGLFSYFFICPTLSEEDESELSSIVLRAPLRCSGETEVVIQRGAYPSGEAYLSLSAAIFSSRLFISLLWTCTERNPVPRLTLPSTRPSIPRRRRPFLTKNSQFEDTSRSTDEDAKPRFPSLLSQAESTADLWPKPLRIRNRKPALLPPGVQPLDTKPRTETDEKKKNKKKQKSQKRPIRRRRSSLWENAGLERLNLPRLASPSSSALSKRFDRFKTFLKHRRPGLDNRVATRTQTRIRANTAVDNGKRKQKRARLSSWWNKLHDKKRTPSGPGQQTESEKEQVERRIEEMKKWTWKTTRPPGVDAGR